MTTTTWRNALVTLHSQQLRWTHYDYKEKTHRTIPDPLSRSVLETDEQFPQLVWHKLPHLLLPHTFPTLGAGMGSSTAPETTRARRVSHSCFLFTSVFFGDGSVDHPDANNFVAIDLFYEGSERQEQYFGLRQRGFEIDLDIRNMSYAYL
jgi:hypothetical protein